MNVTAKVTKLFFDKALVKSAMTKDEQKRLSKAGAFVWTVERRSLRYVTDKPGKPVQVSQPGSPPLAHKKTGGFTKTKTNKKTGKTKTQAASPLRELNYFFYDPSTRSTVIGPIPFGKNPGEAPKLNEFGGIASRTRFVRSKSRDSGRSMSSAAKAAARAKFLAGEIGGGDNPENARRESFQARYTKRPFMGPALAKVVQEGKIPQLWKNCIRSS